MSHRVGVERSDAGSLITIEGVGAFSVPLQPEALPVSGAELSEGEVERLLAALERAALDFGAKMLGIRLMTRSMFVSRMLREGYDEVFVERAAEKFEQLGAIDDAEYARMFAESRKLRGWGRIRIRGELKSRGVSEELIEDVLCSLEDMSEEIERFVSRRAGGGQLDRRQADKIAAALVRRGFSWEEIRPVLRRYTDCE